MQDALAAGRAGPLALMHEAEEEPEGLSHPSSPITPNVQLWPAGRRQRPVALTRATAARAGRLGEGDAAAVADTDGGDCWGLQRALIVASDATSGTFSDEAFAEKLADGDDTRSCGRRRLSHNLRTVRQGHQEN